METREFLKSHLNLRAIEIKVNLFINDSIDDVFVANTEMFIFNTKQDSKMQDVLTLEQFNTKLDEIMEPLKDLGLMIGRKELGKGIYSTLFVARDYLNVIYTNLNRFINCLETNTTLARVWYLPSLNKYSLHSTYHYLQGGESCENFFEEYFVLMKRYIDSYNPYMRDYSKNLNELIAIIQLLESKKKYFFDFRQWLCQDEEYIGSSFDWLVDDVAKILSKLKW